jgi:hypothetical protein
VRDVFCDARVPVSGLRELQRLLGLSSIPLDLDEANAGAQDDALLEQAAKLGMAKDPWAGMRF